MNIESAIVLTLLAAIGVLVGIVWFIYRAIKSGFKSKSVIVITVVIGLSVLLITLSNFQDELFFSKKDAIFFVEEQGIELIDDFEFDQVVNMVSIDGDRIGRGFFTIIISERDKKNGIVKITNSDNFISLGPGDYGKAIGSSGLKVIKNYEINDYFSREYSEPNRQEGRTLTSRSISISKTGNTLSFMDMSY